MKYLIAILSIVFLISAQGFTQDDWFEGSSDNSFMDEPASPPAENTPSPESSSPSAPESEATPTTTVKGDDNKSDNSSLLAGEGFSMGFGVNTVTFEGKTWTRVNLFPAIPVWKFKFAFDVEAFINSEGQFSSKSWDFSTTDAVIDTLQRKIYYISFGDKHSVISGKENIYARVGALDNTTLGRGIIMKNYCNTLYYPLEKQLGFEFSVGNISPIKIGLEGVINNFADVSKGGAVIGTRLFMSPLAPTKVVVLDKIQIGVSFVADINQYSGLKDSDQDTYPDVVDRFPTDSTAWTDTDRDTIPDNLDTDADGDNIPDFSQLHLTNKQSLTNFLSAFMTPADVTRSVDFSINYEDVFSLSNKYDYFSMIGADIIIPVTSFLSIYFQYAMNLDITNYLDKNEAVGWGISGPGIEIDFMPWVRATLEYRRQEGYYQSGYFSTKYDDERVILDTNGQIVTKDNRLNSLTVNGVYGDVLVNLYAIYGYLSYEYLRTEDNLNQIMGVEAKAYLNKDMIKNIPIAKDYIDNVEAYYNHKNLTDFNQLIQFDPGVEMGVLASVNLGGSTKLTYSLKRVYNGVGNFDQNYEDVMTIGTSTAF